METIEVGYRQIGPGYYHQYIIYTNSQGEQYAASGWAGGEADPGVSDFSQGGPSGSGGSGSSGSGSGSGSSGSGSSGSGSSGGDYGDIITSYGPYNSDYPDHPNNPNAQGQQQYFEEIASGSDLSAEWERIKEAMDAIEAEQHQYRPLDQNSNTTAGDALTRAGLPEPQNDDFGDNWAPGADNNLPFVPPPEGTPDDIDGDGIVNEQDDDIDGDGIKNEDDSTPSGADTDGDGEPDAVDSDIDGDGIDNENDDDRDGDNIPNSSDSQPDTPHGQGSSLPETPDSETPPVPETPPRDPLSLDLDNDGVETIGIDAGVFFDLDNNGFSESTAWIGADDAFVVLDRDGNGFIDNGSELFGTETLLSNGEFASNGFEALRELDNNRDGVFDVKDDMFGEVRLWRDANSDGISQADELHTLSEFNIEAINLSYSTSPFTDSNNVEHREIGTYVVRSDSGVSGGQTVDSVAPEGADDDFIANSQMVINASVQNDNVDIRGLSGQFWLQQAYLNAGEGNDTIQGASSNDMLVGGAGNDTLYGNGGSDTYRFGVGSGQDVIINNDSNASSVDTLLLDGNILPENIYIWRDVDDLYLQINGTEDQVRIVNHFQGGSAGIDAIAFDHPQLNGLVWDVTGINENLNSSPPDGALETKEANTLWFDSNTQISVPTDVQLGEELPITESIARLPEVEGIANVRSLHQAMARDDSGELEALVHQFVFSEDAAERHALVTDIVFHWTGQQDVSAESRGHHIDGRKVGALESLWGEELRGDQQDPGPAFSRTLNNLFEQYTDTLYFELSKQSHLQDVFLLSDFTQDAEGNWSGDYTNAITYIFNWVAYNNAEGIEKLDDFHRAIRGINPYDNTPYVDALKAAFEAQLPALEAVDEEAYRLVLEYVRQIDDNLQGTNEADLLEGFAGRDTISGGQGNDTLLGGKDDDSLYGEEDDDTLSGGEGNDRIDGGDGNDTLRGDSGIDTLWGRAGEDYLDGGDGGDALFGGSGDDTLVAGHGDTLSGDEGDDTYLYHLDSGNVTINNFDVNPLRNDALEFSDEIAVDDVQARRSGNDLQLHILSTGSTITVNRYFEDNQYELTSVNFTDGTQWDLEAIRLLVNEPTDNADYLVGYDTNDTLNGALGNDTLIGGHGDDALSGEQGDDLLQGGTGNDNLLGGEGDDDLQGGSGADTLSGGTGNDTLKGEGGDDTYRFALGDGDTTINNFDSGAGRFDQLVLGENILPSDVQAQRLENNDLRLTIQRVDQSTGDTISETITILEHFRGSAYVLNTIEFTDGTVWDIDAINQEILKGTEGDDYIVAYSEDHDLDTKGGNDTVFAGAGEDTIHAGEDDDTVYGQDDNDDLFGEAGNDELHGDDGDDNLDGGADTDQLFGGDGNDTLRGGAGSGDYLQGDRGNDVYLFAAFDGDTTINNEDTSANPQDVLRLIDGLTPADVSALRVNDDLQLTIDSTGEVITVLRHFESDAFALTQIEFSDTTVWDGDAIQQAVLAATEGDDRLIGNSVDDDLDALGGNDEVFGGSGNDTLSGSSGNDKLYGEADHDVLDGGADTDQLFGGDGEDTLRGGTGENDFLQGDAGTDIYQFAKGDGNTTINVIGNGAGENDRLAFLDNTVASDLTLARSDNHLSITINDTGEVITVNHYFASLDNEFSEISFADGSSLSTADIREAVLVTTESADTLIAYETNDTLIGAGGNDTLRGNAGNDNLDGGADTDQLFGGDGNDTLRGGTGDNDFLQGDAGDDTYLFAAGDGNTTINNDDASEGRQDTLQFLAGIAPDDVNARRVNNDLMLTVNATSEIIIVTRFFESSQFALNRIVFDDSTEWSFADIQQAVLTPTVGNDTLVGYAGSDTLQGEGGLDTLIGNAGNDFLFGGADDDILHGGDGEDALSGGEDNDQLFGDADNDALSGGLGNDALSGGTGNDALNGDEGTDSLLGGAGDDTLDGGTGDNDYLEGGDGNDVYLFSAGDGDTTINNINSTTSAEDILRFDNINPNDIYAKRTGDDLFLTVRSTGEVITLTNFFLPTYTLHAIEFADGSRWDVQAINSLTFTDGNDQIIGDENDNYLEAGAGNDNIFGNDGDDILIGGEGNDYLVGVGGNDRYIFSGDFGQDSIHNYGDYFATDTIEFQGYTPEELWFSQDGDRLVITVANSNNSVTVFNWFNDSDRKVEQIQIGQRFLFVENVQTLVDAMAATGLTASQVATSGITTTAAANLQSVLETVWETDAILNGANEIAGDETDNVINGYGGNDKLEGLGGDDTLYGGSGKDRLYGGDGNDTLDGGSESDDIFGGQGDDLIIAGKGNDFLAGQSGNDIYQFSGDFEQGRVANFNGYFDTDTVQFTDRLPEELWFSKDGEDLLITVIGTENQVWVRGWYREVNPWDIEQFDAGSERLYMSEVQTIVDAMTATGLTAADVMTTGVPNNIFNSLDALGIYDLWETAEGNVRNADKFIGVGDTDDSFYGYGGNDHMEGNDGNDLLDGGDGWDKLIGGDGDDIILGGAGQDDLIGGNGDDVMNGGSGGDFFYGFNGADTYIFGRDFGQDRLNNFNFDGIDRPALNIEDIAQFTDGIDANELWFSQEGNDLKISLLATNDNGATYSLTDDQVLVRNWFNDGQWFGDVTELDRIETDTGVLQNDNVDLLVQSLSSHALPVAVGDTISDEAQAALQMAVNNYWDHS